MIQQGQQYLSKNLQNDLILDSPGQHPDALENLTVAEKKVLELIAQHKTSKQIAELLFISEKTVEGHRTNIIQKLKLPKEKNILLVWAIQHFNKK